MSDGSELTTRRLFAVPWFWKAKLGCEIRWDETGNGGDTVGRTEGFTGIGRHRIWLLTKSEFSGRALLLKF